MGSVSEKSVFGKRDSIPHPSENHGQKRVCVGESLLYFRKMSCIMKENTFTLQNS